MFTRVDRISCNALLAAAIALCAALPSHAQPAKTHETGTPQAASRSEMLIKADSSWDGMPYRAYPAGQPLLTISRISVPAGTAMAWQGQSIPTAAYLLSGELSVESQGLGSEKRMRQGEAIAQPVGSVQRIRTGSKPAEILQFSAGAQGMPLQKTDSGPTSRVLLQAEKSWDGASYTYPAGDIELSMMRLTIPAGESLPWHYHEVPEMAYVLSGELTVEKMGETEKTVFRAGDAFAETMGQSNIHRGSAGKEPVVMIGFFAGKKGVPLLSTPR